MADQNAFPSTSFDGQESQKLTDVNSAAYNCHSFAVKVAKRDLFTSESNNLFRTYLATISQLDPRVMWLPTEVIMPSFFKVNTIFYKTFQKYYMDRPMPVTMCVSKTPLKEELNAIFEEHEGDVHDICTEFCNSLKSHTTEQFPETAEPLQGISNILEDRDLGDDEVLLVFNTVFNVIHMLANGDTLVRYSKETECIDLTLGKSLSVPAIKIYTSDKNSAAERYSLDTDTVTKKSLYVLGLGPVVFQEYRHIIRQMFKFGKGDVGSRDDTAESEDEEFESDLLTMLVSSAPPKSPGAIGIVAASLQYNGMINTIVPNSREREFLGSPETIWAMFVVNHVGAFSAPTISHVTVVDSKKEKVLKYHMKSRNPLTNMQFTASRESRTTCGLVLYLQQRLCKARCSISYLNSISKRSKDCEICNFGVNCAMAWTMAFTSAGALIDGVTDSKKSASVGPGSTTVNVSFVSEYNNQASLIGSIGHDKTKAAPAFITAHHLTMERFKDSFHPDKESSGRDVVLYMYALLKLVSEYVKRGEHKQPLLFRKDCKGNKIETVLTDNDGGVPKLSLGLCSMMMAKSKVVTYLSRIAMVVNCKLREFTEKPTNGFNDATSAVASKNIGVYSVKKDQPKTNMKKFFIHPTVAADTDETMDVNRPPVDASIDVLNVYTKTTNKFKMLNGILKGADETSNSYNGGMEFDGLDSNLSNQQSENIKSALSWIIVREVPSFKSSNWGKSINSLVKTLLAAPMGQFNAKELAVSEWEKFLSLYVAGLLMVSHDFYIKSNSYFDGMSIPKFAQLVNAHKVLLDPMSRQFLSKGPAWVFARCKTNSFEANVEGVKNKYISCSLGEFSQLNHFVGNNVMSLSNLPISGVFIPIVQKFSGDDGNRVNVDELCQDIITLASKSLLERCMTVKQNATSYIVKIRERHSLSEDDPVTFDHVVDLFNAYSAGVLLDDPDFMELVKCINNPEDMSRICDGVQAREGNDRDIEDEDGINFNEFETTPSAREEDVGDDREDHASILAEFRDT